jgi:hypothetical protein
MLLNNFSRITVPGEARRRSGLLNPLPLNISAIHKQADTVEPVTVPRLLWFTLLYFGSIVSFSGLITAVRMLMALT